MLGGMGWRAFMFEENGNFRRIPQRVMDGLSNGTVTMPKFAGQSRRFAVVSLETKDRRPVQIISVSAHRYWFDEQGSIEDSVVEGLRDVADVLDDPPPSVDRVGRAGTKKAVSFADRLEEKRRAAYRWEPTPADVTRIVNAIWKK